MEFLLIGLILAAIFIAGPILYERNYGQMKEQVNSKIPGERKIDAILNEKFFINKAQNIKELCSSAAQVILVSRDRVIVLTDLMYYVLFQYNGHYSCYTEPIKKCKMLFSTFVTTNIGFEYALAFGQNKNEFEECYISNDIVNRFGMPDADTTVKNGLVYFSTSNRQKAKVDKISEYIKRISVALCQGATGGTLAQKIEEQDVKKAKQQQSWKAGNWQLPMVAFEQSCKENNVTSVSNERDYLKAKLIVENLMRQDGIPQEYQAQYITQERIKGYFTQLKQRNDAAAQAELQKQINQLRPEEKALEKELTYYAQFTGRDKSIHYCQDRIAYFSNIIWQCEENEKSVRSGGNMLYETGKGHESSWAVHGGIASGIAGAAAGVAVAVDVQRKNAQVRQQNAQLAQSLAEFSVMCLDRIWKEKRKAEEELEHWKAEEKKANLLITQSLDENQLLARLNPRVVNTENSVTGAVKIEVEFQSTTDMRILENVRAVVDGSVKVLLSVDGKTVGSTVCVIKYNGATSKHTAQCICTNVSKQAKTYKISFAPHHLWAVERD